MFTKGLNHLKVRRVPYQRTLISTDRNYIHRPMMGPVNPCHLLHMAMARTREHFSIYRLIKCDLPIGSCHYTLSIRRQSKGRHSIRMNEILPYGAIEIPDIDMLIISTTG